MAAKQLKYYSTKRLNLVAATLEHLNAELDSSEKLSALLNAKVTSEWSLGIYDRETIEHFRELMLEREEELTGWLSWYAIKRETENEPAVLIGAGGFYGARINRDEVEIGYSVSPAYQRKGYGTEIVKALVEIAFNAPNVTCIFACTSDANIASKTVLEKNGFISDGWVDDNGNVLFELELEEHKPDFKIFNLRKN